MFQRPGDPLFRRLALQLLVHRCQRRRLLRFVQRIQFAEIPIAHAILSA
nr:hypothetical protein [Candidatus Sodalis endolongispinus]